VTNALPVKSVAETDRLCEIETGPVVLTPPPGSAAPRMVSTELFKSMTGVEITHVPYKGSAARR